VIIRFTGRLPGAPLPILILITDFIRNTARTAKSLLETGLGARDSPQLAERLKTNQANVTRLERGRIQAPIRTLKRIAERPATISL